MRTKLISEKAMIHSYVYTTVFGCFILNNVVKLCILVLVWYNSVGIELWSTDMRSLHGKYWYPATSG